MTKRLLATFLALIIVFSCFAVFSSTAYTATQRKAPDAFTENEWAGDTTLFQVNREPTHAAFIPYDTIAKAENRVESESNFYQSLNGDWKFFWVVNPAGRDTN
jgi:beta-galactosidase